MTKLQNLTNPEENSNIAQKVTSNGNYQVQQLTYNPLTGWIHAESLSGDGYYGKETKLINVDKLQTHKKLVGAGMPQDQAVAAVRAKVKESTGGAE